MLAPKNTLTSTDGLPFTLLPPPECKRSREEFVEFTGWFQTENRHGTIRFEFFRCISARLLAFGGEADQGRRSKWLAETNKSQKAFFPTSPDNFKDVNHYLLRGHDCLVEVLAEGFTWSESDV